MVYSALSHLKRCRKDMTLESENDGIYGEGDAIDDFIAESVVSTRGVRR